MKPNDDRKNRAPGQGQRFSDKVWTKTMRFLIALWATAGLVSACDCARLPVKDARLAAEIIFRGTVVNIHESPEHFPVATFKVTRVWKGNVSRTFEMLAFREDAGCIGFLPTVEIGADFLIYARRLDRNAPDYLPLPCQTDLISRAGDQLRKLGSGKEPKE
jgi:hypothetical protein